MLMFTPISLSVGLLFFSSVALSELQPVVMVSPDSLTDTVGILDACPTFSWGRFSGAQGYEVMVFHVIEGESTDYQAVLESSQPAVQVQIAAPALSWTPASDQCLEPGWRYVWFVRAAVGEGKGS
jgi:hypothetical protein